MSAALDPRTRRLLEGPIVPTLLRLGAPNVLVMLAQAAVGLIETWFVGRLGTEALAGMSLVFPVVMLMQMTSAGAMGGGIASAIARALGARRKADADALVLHALLIAVLFGLLFMGVVLTGGRWLYASMGGTGAALEAALTYSNWVFAGAIVVWIFNSLSAVLRGTGNMAVPAIVTVGGLLVLVPLSPLLIFGWGPVRGMGIAGGAAALLAYYLLGSLILGAYLWAGKSVLRPSLRGQALRWPLFADILRVGLAGTVSTVATNLAIGITTALVGSFGTAAIAGYGTGARLEYLLVPLVFGLGAPLVAMVGTCIGAGQRERALRATWAGAALSFAMAETIGLLAAAFPHAWLSLFDADPAMQAAGAQYLRAVGPFYGFFGLGLVLYFASQGAGRLFWPVTGNVLRLAVAAIGGWLALKFGGGLLLVFLAQALALLVYGSVNAAAIAGGAWFGQVGWPRRTSALLARLHGMPGS
ncbi:MATE family efflux transporter [Noviherbaspirillum aridicola]|uniref:MATE family efflux transporter n=1 Tax=Noviherbaspirillum aridicola TaxID=2849687 RepID=A0ABQ4Q690_9BURK|nr:MATE family efflux transporter [Noviherbaspirillum aridicola]GIZ52741.1 MATE family efflux transporter [Noviherbaspirillum aridicola]